LNIVEFLSDLRSLDIQVLIDGEKFRCSAPEGILTAELRAKIHERKTEIIEFLKATNRPNNHSFRPLLPIARSENLPLSFAQQRLWFLDQLIPNNPFYNIPVALHLTGSLNLTALEQTFNEIVRRHEALRTTFVMQSGQPVQVINPTLTISLPIQHLRQLSQTEREIEARRFTNQEAQRPFNLSTDSLLQAKLLRLDETQYILLLNMHHIVSDGWSIGVLIQEIAALYTANACNQPSPLPKLATPMVARRSITKATWLLAETIRRHFDVKSANRQAKTSCSNLPGCKAISAIIKKFKQSTFSSRTARRGNFVYNPTRSI